MHSSAFLRWPSERLNPSAADINHIVPNIRTVFDVFQVKNFWDNHWLRCLSKEPYYSAFSAYLQMIRDSSADPQLRTPSTLLMRHKLKAIQVLRQQLADGTHVDDVSLLGIIQLGFVGVGGYSIPLQIPLL